MRSPGRRQPNPYSPVTESRQDFLGCGFFIGPVLNGERGSCKSADNSMDSGGSIPYRAVVHSCGVAAPGKGTMSGMVARTGDTSGNALSGTPSLHTDVPQGHRGSRVGNPALNALLLSSRWRAAKFKAWADGRTMSGSATPASEKCRLDSGSFTEDCREGSRVQFPMIQAARRDTLAANSGEQRYGHGDSLADWRNPVAQPLLVVPVEGYTKRKVA